MLKSYIHHELFHWLEYSIAWNVEAYWGNSFREAQAAWAEGFVIDSTSAVNDSNYPSFANFLETPLHEASPIRKQYGAVLLWDFFGFSSSDRAKPVRDNIGCMRGRSFMGGDGFENCLRQTLADVSGSAEQTLLAFAEALLNLKDPYPAQEGILRWKDYNPHYLPHYLPGQFGGYPHPIPDLRPGSSVMGQNKEVTLTAKLNPFSIQYHFFVAEAGDMVNNVLKATQEGCVGSVACSLFGFRIEENDRSQYRLLFHDRFPESGEISHRFTEPNGEPDMVLLVAVNTDTTTEKTVRLTLTSTTFSRPLHFQIRRREMRNEPNGNYDQSFVEATGILDEPSDMSLKEYPWEGWWQPLSVKTWDVQANTLEVTNRRAFRLVGLVPFREGTIRTQIARGDFEGGPPGRRVDCAVERITEEQTRGSGTLQMSTNERDGAPLLLSFDEDNPESPVGQYHFSIAYREPYPGAESTTQQICHACCDRFEPGAPRQNEEVIEWGYLKAEGPFEDGDTVLTFDDDGGNGEGYVIEGGIQFPEPIEVPRWLRFNREGYMYGGLYDPWCRNPPGGLVPALYDFHLPTEGRGS
ncbi:MAG: hypothetical protein HY465_05995 [Deltaproteobacteria bacterium]|nr:hypothetical protein [Deltaproteobacteria bacterium]